MICFCTNFHLVRTKPTYLKAK